MPGWSFARSGGKGHLHGPESPKEQVGSSGSSLRSVFSGTRGFSLADKMTAPFDAKAIGMPLRKCIP